MLVTIIVDEQQENYIEKSFRVGQNRQNLKYIIIYSRLSKCSH